MLKHGCLRDENRAIRRFSRLLHSPSLRLRDGNPTIHTPSSRPSGRESQSDAEPDSGNRRAQHITDSLDRTGGRYAESDSEGSHSDSLANAYDDIVRGDWEYSVWDSGAGQAGLRDQPLLAWRRIYRRPRLSAKQRSQGSVHGKNLPSAVTGPRRAIVRPIAASSRTWHEARAFAARRLALVELSPGGF